MLALYPLLGIYCLKRQVKPHIIKQSVIASLNNSQLYYTLYLPGSSWQDGMSGLLGVTAPSINISWQEAVVWLKLKQPQSAR